MRKSYVDVFREVYAEITDPSQTLYWANKIRDDYGIRCGITKSLESPHLILRRAYRILSKIGKPIIKACKITKLFFRDDMGESKRYSPNHGYYHDNSITLNSAIFTNPDLPDDFFDDHGYFLTRGEQTLAHEMGHAFDAVKGEISLKPEWMKLSGWSHVPKPGLKRLIINEPGTPKVVGEMWFDPHAEFTRFYGKRNAYDDFADCFSFYVCGLKEKVPAEKRKYLDKVLKDIK